MIPRKLLRPPEEKRQGQKKDKAAYHYHFRLTTLRGCFRFCPATTSQKKTAQPSLSSDRHPVRLDSAEPLLLHKGGTEGTDWRLLALSRSRSSLLLRTGGPESLLSPLDRFCFTSAASAASAARTCSSLSKGKAPLKIAFLQLFVALFRCQRSLVLL